MSPGETCAAPAFGGLCSPEEVVFYCPWWNLDPTFEPLVVGLDWQLRCQVCGVASAKLFDADVRKGYLLLDLTFGPNFREGNFFEDEILSYAVYVVNTDGKRLIQEKVGEVAKLPYLPDSEMLTCCKDTYYTVRVNAALPSNTSRAMLEIVPVTFAGPMPVGIFTDVIEDATYRSTTAGAQRHTPSGPSASLILPMALTLVSLFRPPGGVLLPSSH